MNRLAKKEDCAIVIGDKPPVIMEVIGINGQKVGEYVDKGNDKLPYYQLHETVVIE